MPERVAPMDASTVTVATCVEYSDDGSTNGRVCAGGCRCTLVSKETEAREEDGGFREGIGRGATS
jgi:hypothetical protein